jgi:hypothetical protein
MHDYQTYNGWCNRETWLVSLWLNNDPASEDVLRRVGKQSGDACDKSEWLERQLQNALDDHSAEASLWTDLLRTSLGRVNWLEVVESN